MSVAPRLSVLSTLAAGLVLLVGCAKDSGYPNFVDIVDRASPSVVNISTVSRVDAGMTRDMPEFAPLPFEAPGGSDAPMEDMESLGSGFVLWSDGYIVTNRHVVRDADEIIVRLLDRRQFAASVVGIDERSDIALLKIDARGLPAARIGDSELLRVGEWVLAIGSPFGFDHSVTSGIVSAKGRNLASEQYVPFIQTDVAINQGNSGGPLFNLKGEVVGVNSQIYSQTGGYMGISFAIPIDVALKVAEQLRDRGQVLRGWLGVVVQPITRELAQSFGMNRPEGALVARVMPNSPAERAGLRTGDIILNFNGRVLPSSEALPPLVGNTDPGDLVPLQLLRDGERMAVNVTIGVLAAEGNQDSGIAPSAPSSGPIDRTGSLGLVIEPLTPEDRQREQVVSGGVLVAEVDAGPARDAGLRAGDVILSIGGSTVDSPARFDEVVKRLAPGQQAPILVQRRGAPLFLAIKAPPR
ncbi:DegQ family serine endoprotease [Algiphilus sp. W345]|uniref:Probable periplasmic serine endoprotease DegP-like n=1 Tax=Banduia mediterranea TaxID=3075609 RepID=A0ABU2WKL3_9GAMM|nr:DegQ family serine endoprotease [Algiphilus sp. W345]MDT0498428.1 DegQ family serine endoprotease [Algiphilus sp. W345]